MPALVLISVQVPPMVSVPVSMLVSMRLLLLLLEMLLRFLLSRAKPELQCRQYTQRNSALEPPSGARYDCVGRKLVRPT